MSATNIVEFRYKLGRCSNGAELDKGNIYHAVIGSGWKAICGTEPGRTSAGWSESKGHHTTCRKCEKKLRAMRLLK